MSVLWSIYVSICSFLELCDIYGFFRYSYKCVYQKKNYIIGQCAFIWNIKNFKSPLKHMSTALDKTSNLLMIKRYFCVVFDYHGSKLYLQVTESSVSQPEQKA